MADDTRRKIADARQNWDGGHSVERVRTYLHNAIGGDMKEAIADWLEAEKVVRLTVPARHE
jgi:hypothetical protein